MRHALVLALAAGLWLGAVAPGQAQVSSFMSNEIAGATYVAPYGARERAVAAQRALGLSAAPRLAAAVSVTPNQPYADDGTRLHFWKPSFLIGAPDGGEAGVNFWGVHVEGHINVGFTPGDGRSRLVDCRVISRGPITYKIFTGPGETPVGQGQTALADGHFFLMVPVADAGALISVELWPTPLVEPMGFLGCEISPVR